MPDHGTAWNQDLNIVAGANPAPLTPDDGGDSISGYQNIVCKIRREIG
jgi:hypothetical protein